MYIRYNEDQDLYHAPRYIITINTAVRKMTLFRNGKVFKTYPIAIGKMTDPIPTSKIKNNGLIS
jgi:hypothetical protein